MLFDIKSIILYGLIAIAQAYPVHISEKNKLDKQSKHGDFICPDDKWISEDVVTKYKDKKGDSGGVMQHIGATIRGAYINCTRATEIKTNEEKGKQDKEKSVGDASPSVPRHHSRKIIIRAKKKKVGSVTCDSGVTLSKDDVGNAFVECKNHNDRTVGSYPHKFGNLGKNGDNVFEGVTKDLREYPILQGRTWTKGDDPGKYRVVTDYKDNFVGVMKELPGGQFEKCVVKSD